MKVLKPPTKLATCVHCSAELEVDVSDVAHPSVMKHPQTYPMLFACPVCGEECQLEERFSDAAFTAACRAKLAEKGLGKAAEVMAKHALDPSEEVDTALGKLVVRQETPEASVKRWIVELDGEELHCSGVPEWACNYSAGFQTAAHRMGQREKNRDELNELLRKGGCTFKIPESEVLGNDARIWGVAVRHADASEHITLSEPVSCDGADPDQVYEVRVAYSAHKVKSMCRCGRPLTVPVDAPSKCEACDTHPEWEVIESTGYAEGAFDDGGPFRRTGSTFHPVRISDRRGGPTRFSREGANKFTWNPDNDFIHSATDPQTKE